MEHVQNNSKQNIWRKWLHKRTVWCSYQRSKRLFVLAYRERGAASRVTADSHRSYFLPRVKIKNYNIEIGIKNFYAQSINDLINQ